MDFLTLCGAVVGIAAIVLGFALEGGRFASLFQLEALVIVLRLKGRPVERRLQE